MRVLVIYFSFHHLNTKKIAETMGEELEARVLEGEQAQGVNQKRI